MTGGEIDINTHFNQIEILDWRRLTLSALSPSMRSWIKVLICWFNCTWRSLTEILLAPPVSATVRIVTS